jgi:tetratricopeptide (TPR) repeat protein
MPLWVACSTVAPDPATASAESLPVVELSEAQLAKCENWEAQATDAVMRRQYAKAEQLADRVLAENPRSGVARAVLGMVKLQRAAEQQPTDWFDLRAGEYELQLALQLAPASAFVGWMHAVFLAESGHMSAAAQAAEDALDRSKDAPESERAALLGIAGRYRYELGEERAALPHLQAYVVLRPDDSAAQFRLGSSLLSISSTPQGSPVPYQRAQSEAVAAATAFAHCYELAPGDEDAALSIAAAWLRAGEVAEKRKKIAERDTLYERAVGHLEIVAEKFPRSAEVHFRLGVMASLRQETAVAQAAYVAALERDPNHAGSLMNLAACLEAQGDNDGAAELLNRLLALPASESMLKRGERSRIDRWMSSLAKPSDGVPSANAGG